MRLLIFLPAILIPACATSSPAFLMMYSAYKLNKQGDNIQPTYSFPDLEPVCWSMSDSNCCFLTCMQVSQEAGQVVWHSHLLKNFPQFVWPPGKPKNTGVGSLSFLQGSFLTQELKRGLLHCRLILYQLSYSGSPQSRCRREKSVVLKLCVP